MRIGSSISGGRSLRMPEISSRISCVACCGSFSKTNSTMMLPKLSSELDRIRSTPLMPEITSSIGSMTSRSTTSGDAPGYGIDDDDDRRVDLRELVGVELQQRDDAEDDEHQHRDDGEDRALDGGIGDEHDHGALAHFAPSAHLAPAVPGVMPCAAPRSRMSPSFSPDSDLHPLGPRIAQAERHVDPLGLAVRHAQHPRRRPPSC